MDLMTSIISSWYLILSSLNSSSLVELLTYAERQGRAGASWLESQKGVGHPPRDNGCQKREAELQLFYHRIHQYKPTATILWQSYFKLSTTQTVLAFFKPRSHGLIKMNSVKCNLIKGTCKLQKGHTVTKGGIKSRLYVM